VELRKTKGRPQLWTYGIDDESLDIHLQAEAEKTAADLLLEDKPELAKQVKKKKENELLDFADPRVDRYADLLKQLLKQAKITTRRATASLPVSYIFHAIVTLPKVDDKEIEHMVMAELKKMVQRPLEEMQVVWQKVPESENDKQKKYLRILVTAAPRALVKFYSSIFSRAGLELQELETEAFAIERSLVGRDSATAMVVDIGAERTNFFIIDQSLPLTHRSINVGGDLLDKILQANLGLGSREQAQQIKYSLEHIKNGLNSDAFEPVIEPIIKEIKYGFDLYLNQSGNVGKHPEKIVLTGGCSVIPFFKERISQEFPLKVFVGDPWARVVYPDSLKKTLDIIGPRMSVAIGLALRNIVK
jgi:type IV pilus assembly protein PilM